MRRLALPVLTLLTAGLAAAAPLPVTATTSVVADFVSSVGGNRVSVNVLVPANADTHTFQPTTRDVRSLAGSKLVFENGANLEPWFTGLRANAASKVPVITLTQGLKLREGHEEHAASPDAHDHGDADPHAWWDPANAVAYTNKVRDALIRADPTGKALYTANAARHVSDIKAAAASAKQMFAKLPASARKLVTNHDALGYFAAYYGFQILGEVIPGLGTEREPSARETAQLITNIRKTGVKAIFTENTVNPRLASSIARESGAKIAPALYTDALGAPGSAGDTYLKALKYNVSTIYNALK